MKEERIRKFWLWFYIFEWAVVLVPFSLGVVVLFIGGETDLLNFFTSLMLIAAGIAVLYFVGHRVYIKRGTFILGLMMIFQFIKIMRLVVGGVVSAFSPTILSELGLEGLVLLFLIFIKDVNFTYWMVHHYMINSQLRKLQVKKS